MRMRVAAPREVALASASASQTIGLSSSRAFQTRRPTASSHRAAFLCGLESRQSYWSPQTRERGCVARYKSGETQPEGPKQLIHRTALTTMLGALLPVASRAEQHSGLFAIADIDAKTAGSIAAVLGPVLSLSILLMICRIPLSWYPNLNVKRLPWIIAVAPTEPVLGPTRRAIPPVGGVDIAPIIWTAVLSFINEILLGPQGILNLLQRKVDL